MLIFIFMERQIRQSKATHGERIVKDIKLKTRKQYSDKEKIRIVLDGLRGKKAPLNLCRSVGVGTKRSTKCNMEVFP